MATIESNENHSSSNCIQEDQLQMSGDDDDKSNKYKPSWLIYMATFGAQLLSLSFGMTMGWTSIANEELDSNFNITNPNDHWKTPVIPNEMEKQLIASIWTIGSVFGGFTSGYLIDKFGRKKVLIALGIPFTLAWLMIGLAQSSLMIIIGRIINGFGVGISMATIPRYLAEICTPKIRGYIGMTVGYFACLGMFMVNIFNVLNFHWNHLGFLAIILMMIIMFFMPESPIWCINFISDKDKAIREAEKNLKRFRSNDSDLQQEINDIIEMKNTSDKTNETNHLDGSLIRSIRRKDIYKPFFISMLLMTFQQFCGASIVIYSMNDIFRTSGSTLSSKQSSSVTNGIMLVMVIIGSFLIDRFGRRILIMISGAAQALSIGILGIYYYQHISDIQQSSSLLPIICVSIFVSGYSLGMGGICWLIIAEITPPQAVWLVMSISSVYSGIGTFIMIVSTKSFFHILKEYGTYWLFTVINIIIIIFGYFLPETKGRTIDEISKIFKYN
ncbi:facilitated trehalose transporter Tret1-like [Dermatophagoides pteronyssinus]|uniref:facilitated trehalose transporter Tret1-like n=1 Tax=Dermatophagoides pteronyssinus TaxID=6956 RepID=UPI003F672084